MVPLSRFHPVSISGIAGDLPGYFDVWETGACLGGVSSGVPLSGQGKTVGYPVWLKPDNAKLGSERFQQRNNDLSK